MFILRRPLGVKRELAYYGHAMRKQGSCLGPGESDNARNMPGAHRRLHADTEKQSGNCFVMCPRSPSSVLFFSRPRSEGWPHRGRTFSIIYPGCLLSF